MRIALVCAAASLLAVTGARATCISGNQIDHTGRPNDKTVVFYMTDHHVYRNDLPVRCPNLTTIVDGFTFQPTDPATGDLCDGMAVIRMNDQGHASCVLGNFTQVK